MTPAQVSPRLTRWIERHFGAGGADRVLAELRALPPVAIGGQDVERIHASLVIRTRGDWRRFQGQLVLVNLDWRDALVAADLADADWPARLDAVLGRE